MAESETKESCNQNTECSQTPSLNVQVAVRVRPLLGTEKVQGGSIIARFSSDQSQILLGQDRSFNFDYVFNPMSTQVHVFDSCVSPLVQTFLRGFNATIFAYGQTGSGKTYSMGTSGFDGCGSHDLGIVPRVIDSIFEYTSKATNSKSISLKATFLEIHNEELRDLLRTSDDPLSLTVREDQNGEIIIQGLQEKAAATRDDLFSFLCKGSMFRSTGSTLMNAHSSRSHAIFTIYLTQEVQNDSGDIELLNSKFHFVDLAGSERLKKTQAVGQRMREGININSGLLALGNVISALSDPKRSSGHIPFRDSKITRLLQDSLGGNSQTLMLACISPAESNYDESLNTLRYASRARNIKNKPVVNRDSESAKVIELNQRIRMLEGLLNQAGVSNVPDQLHIDTSELDNEILRLSVQIKQCRSLLSECGEKLRVAENDRDLAYSKMSKLVKAFGIKDVDLAKIDICQDDLNVQVTLREELRYLQTQLDLKDKEIFRLLRERAPIASSLSQHMEEENASDIDSDSDGNQSEASQILALESFHQEREKEFLIASENMKRSLKGYDCDIIHKEKLIEELRRSRRDAEMMKASYEQRIQEMESEIGQIQIQRDHVIQNIEMTRDEQKDKLLNSQAEYEKRLKSLKSQLGAYRQKMKENQRMLSIKARDSSRISKLEDEVSKIKSNKVKLQRQMKEEAERQREWSESKKREILLLQKKSRQKDIELSRVKNDALKQERVLQSHLHQNARLHKQLSDMKSAKKGKVSYSDQSLKTSMTMKEDFRRKIWENAQIRCLKEYLSESYLEKAELTKEIDRLKHRTDHEFSDECAAEIESHENTIKEIDSKVSSWESKLAKLVGSHSGKDSRHFNSSLEALRGLTDADQFRDLVPYIMNIASNGLKAKLSLKKRLAFKDQEILLLKEQLQQQNQNFSRTQLLKRERMLKRESKMVKEYESNIRELAGIPEKHANDIDERMPKEKGVKEVRFQLDEDHETSSSDEEEDVFTRLYANFTNVWRAKLNEIDRKPLKRPRSVLKEDGVQSELDCIDYFKRPKESMPNEMSPQEVQAVTEKENGSSVNNTTSMSNIVENRMDAGKDEHDTTSALPRMTWQSLSSLFSSKSQ